ncbi:Oral cancer-overexpressed protein 1 [Wallemia ichthyophaga EXF-994]|uniref:Oral cancer-overexpressed protein 1 n=1 Tax=Wallemia ichthyophaga (strain EXF-994 / CBS 113033) TaxID=1299270 RepID=R9ACN1_WALI9|nr:Oral cancer-overexpressed protein 1 [Wallemia ichthyophaga EXF-994]EOQ99897.1 Oral cancer-overexpressed protein 1 [Wallemia ichthyophaga EXF-994]
MEEIMPIDEIDSINHLEQTFYNAGYQSGYDHGKIHGKIEGRALGKEKGYEIWEELGFMEASAVFLLSTQPDSKHKAHAQQIIEMIQKFPQSNAQQDDSNEEWDMSNLLEKIRAKFKVFVTTTGVKRRLKTAAPTQSLGF